MRRWLWALCTLVAFAACDEPKAKEPEMTRSTSKVPADLRAEILAQVKPFAGHPEYAVDDPDLVDPCIGDRAPTSAERADFIHDAVVCIQNALDKPDGLARIAKRVAERYANPKITRAGDVVTIDAGVVAGKLHLNRTAVEVWQTDNLDAGEWATAEVVKFLKLGMAKFPGAKTYVARCEIPRRGGAPEWTYSYDRAEDRIRVWAKSDPNAVYVSETLGGDPAHAKTLQAVRLKRENVEQPPPWR